MKSCIARISLAIAAVLFSTGFSVPFLCPGWYSSPAYQAWPPWNALAAGWFALAAVFAGGAIWAGIGRMRAFSFACLLACLSVGGSHTVILIRKHYVFIDSRDFLLAARDGDLAEIRAML